MSLALNFCQLCSPPLKKSILLLPFETLTPNLIFIMLILFLHSLKLSPSNPNIYVSSFNSPLLSPLFLTNFFVPFSLPSLLLVLLMHPLHSHIDMMQILSMNNTMWMTMILTYVNVASKISIYQEQKYHSCWEK